MFAADAKAGDTKTVTATITNADAMDKRIRWESSDPSKVSVVKETTESGVANTLKLEEEFTGEVTIYAYPELLGKEKGASITATFENAIQDFFIFGFVGSMTPSAPSRSNFESLIKGNLVRDIAEKAMSNEVDLPADASAYDCLMEPDWSIEYPDQGLAFTTGQYITENVQFAVSKAGKALTFAPVNGAIPDTGYAVFAATGKGKITNRLPSFDASADGYGAIKKIRSNPTEINGGFAKEGPLNSTYAYIETRLNMQLFFVPLRIPSVTAMSWQQYEYYFQDLTASVQLRYFPES